MSRSTTRSTKPAKLTGSFARFAEIKKNETRILGDVQQHLLTCPDDDRRQDVLHPSDLAKDDFCPRAAFYRIIGAEGTADIKPAFQMENIWENGHDIHAKWQRWIDALGKLYGEWYCLRCSRKFLATSPLECANCLADRIFLQYREVPADGYDEYLIVGRGDGQIVDDKPTCWVEVKSIGLGTVRFEEPKLLRQYTHKTEHGSLVDFDRLWLDIRRPFPSHIRQGMLYLAVTGVEWIVFIYEYKPTQSVKEFRMKYSEAVAAPLLETALDVKYAVENGRVPGRPLHAPDRDAKVCKACVFRDTICWTGEQNRAKRRTSTAARPSGAVDRDSTAGTSRPRATGAVPAGQTTRRVTHTARGSSGADRRDPDEEVQPSHPLGRLFERAARAR